MNLRQVVAGFLRGFQPGQVGVHHGPVPFDGEDQRHVDRDALADHRGDGRQAGFSGRDLDQQVGPVDDLPQLDGLQDRLVGVVRQPRIHLDRHPAVHTAGRPVDLGEQVAGLPHIVGGDGADRRLDIGAAHGQFGDQLVVGVARRKRRLEDRRIGRHPDHALGVPQLGQLARPQPIAGQVVKPHGHTRRRQRGEIGILSHRLPFC